MALKPPSFWLVFAMAISCMLFAKNIGVLMKSAIQKQGFENAFG